MERHVSRSVANFGAKLFKKADTRVSTLCSPLSAEMVMAMLALCCKDKSNAELLTALGIPDDDALRSSFAFLTSTMKSIRGVTLNVANKIYVKTGAELKPGVKKYAKELFESSVEQLDFNSQEAAAIAINNWLAQQTNSNITLDAGLDVSTRLVLVNAIYFQGVWEKPFDTRLDTYSLFYTLSTYIQRDPDNFMRIPTTWFNYGVSQELMARLLQLKFEGGEASMVIVLPDEVDGLSSILQKLDSGHDIMADIETLKYTKLNVMMPTFEGRITSQVNFVSHLVKLGIRSIFDERKSEVDIFTDNDELLGSNAGHNTLIKVDNRESTRDADYSMEDISTDPSVENFVADRPFLYMIIVRGLPIFMGSYKFSRENIRVLNYSCNNLSHSFSLSVSTFYSRYDNTREQERLKQIMEDNARRVAWETSRENRRNTLIEQGQPDYRHPVHYLDIDENMPAYLRARISNLYADNERYFF